jgi:hypothetical protein
MADSEFWRDLISWAKALSETASLHWNKAHTAVELGDVSYEMRQNLESLTRRAGHHHLLAEVYVYFRGQAVDAIAKGERPGFFHPLPYRRTAYRGGIEMESRSMDGYIQPLRDALREYGHEREAAEHPGKPSKTGAKASDLAVCPKSSGDCQDDMRTPSGISAAIEASEQPEAARGAVAILRDAMEKHGWNVAKLAAMIQTFLRRKRVSKPKGDKTAIYRILSGETKKPNPAIRNALIEVLGLEPRGALVVRHQLGGVEPPSSDKKRLGK